MMGWLRSAAWTLQVVAIYMLAEFAVFTIAGKLMVALGGHTQPAPWLSILFLFLPITLSAWWMLGVLFGPRPSGDGRD